MIFEEALNTTKAKSEKLGIPAGLTQEQFNQAIVSYLEKLQSAPSSAPESTISSAADITTTAGRNLVKTLYFDPSAADIKTELKDSAIDITYNLTEMLKSLPKDAEVKRTSVVLNGKKQIIANSDKSVLTVSAPPSEFPVSLDITVKGATAQGEFLVRGTKELKAEDMSGLVQFSNSVSQATSVETQEDLNKKILEEISYIKRLLP